MNKLDTALVCSSLKQADFLITDHIKEAGVVLINTCSVREHAEQRVLSHLGHLKHIKQTRPNLLVAVFGCMAQRLGAELLQHDAVDIVCGPAQIPQLTALLADTLQRRQKIVAVTEKIRTDSPPNTALEQFESVHDSDDKQIPSQAFVRVMRGCNKFCTYCVVPYVRGPEVSRPPAAIIEQIKRLADEGVKQITLLGQTVNSYEYHCGEKIYCLADLLEMAGQIDGIEWLRFVTSYPTEKFFDRIMQAVGSLPKVCNYLHIPAQSGSDKILKAMNRNYTAAGYLQLLEKARDLVGDIAIAGDFIVGFPGETDADFQQSVDLLEKARYKNCFVFKYSPRPGTTADKKLEDTVAIETKKQRNKKMLAVQEQISDQLSKKFLGKTVRLLVEGLSKKSHLNSTTSEQLPQLVGRTADDWIVVFTGSPHLAGKFVHAKIIETSPLTLFGQLSTSNP